MTERYFGHNLPIDRFGNKFHNEQGGNKMASGYLGNGIPPEQSGNRILLNRLGHRFPSLIWGTIFLSIGEDADFPSDH